MKALVAVLERIAAALEQLVPALTQATREHHYTFTGTAPQDDPPPRYPGTDGNA